MYAVIYYYLLVFIVQKFRVIYCLKANQKAFYIWLQIVYSWTSDKNST